MRQLSSTVKLNSCRRKAIVSIVVLFLTLAASSFQVEGLLVATNKTVTARMTTSTSNTALHLSKCPSPSQMAVTVNSIAGGLTFGGGLIGFLTKGSKASLVAGSGFGGLLGVSTQLIRQSSSRSKKVGLSLGTAVGGALTYVMGKKFWASQKFMPAGLVAMAGMLSFLVNTLGLILFNKEQEDSAVIGNEKKES